MFRSLKKGRALGAGTQTTEEEALSGVGADASRTQRRPGMEARRRGRRFWTVYLWGGLGRGDAVMLVLKT